MKENNPLLSVIIAVYNRELFLAEAIDSVLAQTYSPVEIIVIDDGSDDNSASIAKRYHSVKYFYQSKSGISTALNNGLSHITGDYIAFLDSDDIWEESKLSLQMELLKKEPFIEGVFGHHQQFMCNEDSLKIMNPIILSAPLKQTLLIKRDSFKRVGLFDTSLILGDFIDWYKRATDMDLKFYMLPDVVLKRRIHENNSSVLHQYAVKDYVRIMKAALDRKRIKEAEELDSINNQSDE